MPLSSRIAPHLPLLRRYARAVSGSQKSGDAYVAAALEALIDDVSIFPDAPNDRVALYQLLSAFFGSVHQKQSDYEPVSLWERKLQNGLSIVSPLSRQAFLLVSVEGFSKLEAAQILRKSEDELDRLLHDASQAVAEQATADIMIIEDEPLIAMDIESMVEDIGHKPVGIARTHSEAVELFNKTRPQLILSDIQLADGSSGIDAVNEILGTHALPVIFITAFPERLLTGERPEPAFLVTKPFDPAMVKALISQALFFDDAVQQQKESA